MEGESSKSANTQIARSSKARKKIKQIGPKSRFTDSFESKTTVDQGDSETDEQMPTSCNAKSDPMEKSVDGKQDYEKLVTPCFVRLDSNEVSIYLQAVALREREKSLNRSSDNQTTSSLNTERVTPTNQKVKSTVVTPQRGRKRKHNNISPEQETCVESVVPSLCPTTPKRKRGRPKKISVEPTVETVVSPNSEIVSNSNIEPSSETCKIETNSNRETNCETELKSKNSEIISENEIVEILEMHSESAKVEFKSKSNKIKPKPKKSKVKYKPKNTKTKLKNTDMKSKNSDIKSKSVISKIETNIEKTEIELIYESSIIQSCSENSEISISPQNSEISIIQSNSESPVNNAKPEIPIAEPSSENSITSSEIPITESNSENPITEFSSEKSITEPNSEIPITEPSSENHITEPSSENPIPEPNSENPIPESNSEILNSDIISKNSTKPAKKLPKNSKIKPNLKKSTSSKISKKYKKTRPPIPKTKTQKYIEPLIENGPLLEYTNFGLLSLHNMRPRNQVSYNVTSRRKSRDSECKTIPQKQYMECKICKNIYTSHDILETHVKSHGKNIIKNYTEFFNELNDITGKENMVIIKTEENIDSDSSSDFEGYTENEINSLKLDEYNRHAYICVICEEEFYCKNSIKSHISNHINKLQENNDINDYYIETVNNVPINCYIDVNNAFLKCKDKNDIENLVKDIVDHIVDMAIDIGDNMESCKDTNVISDVVNTLNVPQICNTELNSVSVDSNESVSKVKNGKSVKKSKLKRKINVIPMSIDNESNSLKDTKIDIEMSLDSKSNNLNDSILNIDTVIDPKLDMPLCDEINVENKGVETCTQILSSDIMCTSSQKKSVESDNIKCNDKITKSTDIYDNTSTNSNNEASKQSESSVQVDLETHVQVTIENNDEIKTNQIINTSPITEKSIENEQVKSNIDNTNKYISLLKPFEIRLQKLEDTPEIKLLKNQICKRKGRPRKMPGKKIKSYSVQSDIKISEKSESIITETKRDDVAVEEIASTSETTKDSSLTQATPSKVQEPVASTSSFQTPPSSSQTQLNSPNKRKTTPTVKINYKRKHGKYHKQKPKSPVKKSLIKNNEPKIKKTKPDFNFMPLPSKLKRESKPKMKLEVSLHAFKKYDEIIDINSSGTKIVNPNKSPSKRKQSLNHRNISTDYVKSLQDQFEKSLESVPKTSNSTDNEPYIKCHLCESWVLKENLQFHVTSVHLKANFTLFSKPKKKPDLSKPIQNEMVTVYNSQNSNFKLTETQENIDPTVNCNFTCKICSVSFNTVEKLGEHLISVHNIHENDEFSNLQCDHCTETFDNDEQLNEHVILVHDSDEHSKLACSQCSLSFDTEEQLDLHVLNLHSVISVSAHQCSQCGQGFDTKQQLDTHVEEIHEAFKILPLCKICYLCKKSSDIINIDCARYKALEERALEENKEDNEDVCVDTNDKNLENIIPKSFESCEHLKQFVFSTGLEDKMQHLHFYQCESCGTVLVGKEVYTEHIAVHQKELDKKYNEMLSKSKKKKKTLYKSPYRKNINKKPTLKTIQKGKIEKRQSLIKKYKCKACSRRPYQTQQALAMHYEKYHNIEDINIITTKCQYCQTYVLIEMKNIENQTINLSQVSCSIACQNKIEDDNTEIDIESIDPEDPEVSTEIHTEVSEEVIEELVVDDFEMDVNISTEISQTEIQKPEECEKQVEVCDENTEESVDNYIIEIQVPEESDMQTVENSIINQKNKKTSKNIIKPKEKSTSNKTNSSKRKSTRTKLTDEELETPAYEHDLQENNEEEQAEFSLVYSSDEDNIPPNCENISSEEKETTNSNNITTKKSENVSENNIDTKLIETEQIDNVPENVENTTENNISENETQFVEEEESIGNVNPKIPNITDYMENPITFNSNYPCLCCSKICQTPEELTKHSQLHNACLSCDTKFHSRASYKKHKLLHEENEIRYYQCQCTQLISSFESLDTHILKFHSKDINTYYQNFKRNVPPQNIIITNNIISCVYCINVFYTENDYQNHIQNWHNIQNCNLCINPFHNCKMILPPYCNNCEKLEKQKSSIVKTETIEKTTESDDEDIMITNEFLVEKEIPNKIQVVNIKPKSPSNKSLHKNTLVNCKNNHGKVETYTLKILKKVEPKKQKRDITCLCKKCYQQFTSIESLNDHFEECRLTIYACEICSEHFQNQCSIQLHMNLVHMSGKLIVKPKIDEVLKTKVYQCETCKYVFANRDIFLKHNGGDRYEAK